jgi:hypothetical protein
LPLFHEELFFPKKVRNGGMEKGEKECQRKPKGKWEKHYYVWL